MAAPRAEILSPKDQSRVLGDSVVARVATRGVRFRAYLDGRNVTRSFQKVAPGVRRGTLDLGDELSRGEADLFVRAGPRFKAASDSARFALNPRRDRVMKLTAKPRRTSHAAPRLSGKLRRPIEELLVRLNGKRVDEELETTKSLKRFDGKLGAHAGLRFGGNRLRVKAFDEGGRVAIEKLSFRVPRQRPLVGAGSNLTSAVGTATRLDGSSTKPAAPGRELTYNWEVIEAPKGSEATLSGEATVEPVLTPDLPGEYIVQLTASQPGAGTARDTVAVTSRATDEILGLPIQTITSDGEIQIGEPSEPGSLTVSRFGNWVQLVQLDATSGGLFPGTIPQSFEVGNSSELVDAVKGVDENALVILTGQGLPQTRAGSRAASDLEKAFELLGGTLDGCDGCPTATPAGGSDLNASGAWSLIGQLGLQRGYANQNFGLRRAGVPGFLGGSQGQAGSLNGYLGHITSDLGYQFVSSDYVGIDTRYTPNPTDTPPTNQNTIAITRPDGTVEKHDSGPIPDGAVAIHALVLDGSDLSPLDNNTNTVINPDGSSNRGQVFFIKELLNGVVRNSGAGESPVVILQEFGGHDGRSWPGGDLTDWVADTLPSTDSNTAWNGGHVPTSSSDLAKSWNQADKMGSVAGNVGVLAGPSAHDVIANFRRPYWDQGKAKVADHDQTGLAVIASANAYQRSGAFVSAQPDSPDPSGGRVTGILRRNEQSQWELSSHSLGAGFAGLPDGGVFDAKAFWDLAFTTAPEPFPCSAVQPAGCAVARNEQPPSSEDLANAEQDIAALLFPNTGATTVRDEYAKRYLPSGDFLTYANTLNQLRCPSQRTGGYSCRTFNLLRKQLDIEFNMVNRVAIGIDSWSGFFSYKTVGPEGQQILTSVANEVISNLHDVESKVLSQDAEAEAGAGASDSLLLISELIEGGIAIGAPEAAAIAPPTLGAIAAVIDLSDAVSTPEYGKDEETAVANDTDAINETVQKLSNSLFERYQTLSSSMTFFGSVFVDDWAKLQAASDNFAGDWAFEVGPTGGQTTARIAQAANLATAEAVYEATMPIAYKQWMISPRYTRFNGLAALDLPHADRYHCADVNVVNDPDDTGFGSRPPIRTSTTTWAQTSVAWYGSTELGSNTAGFNGPLSNYTVRFLKSAADNLRSESYELTDSVDEVGVQHAGTDAKSSLFGPLFTPVNITEQDFMEPESIGMNKDEFFGLPNWSIQKLQCGTSNGF